jgi:hypothetical protein
MESFLNAGGVLQPTDLGSDAPVFHRLHPPRPPVVAELPSPAAAAAGDSVGAALIGAVFIFRLMPAGRLPIPEVGTKDPHTI